MILTHKEIALKALISRPEKNHNSIIDKRSVTISMMLWEEPWTKFSFNASVKEDFTSLASQVFSLASWPWPSNQSWTVNLPWMFCHICYHRFTSILLRVWIFSPLRENKQNRCGSNDYIHNSKTAFCGLAVMKLKERVVCSQEQGWPM